MSSITEAIVYDLEGKPAKKLTLPKVFQTSIRPDLIQRAFLASFTARLQPQGRDVEAGMRTTAESWGVGYGVARVPRVKGTSRAALAPMTVGGRRAHPPRVEKVLVERINVKEKRLAIASAIAATANKELVKARGHRFDDSLSFPLIVVDDVEAISTAIEAKKFLVRLGLWSDVERAKNGIKIKAGRGKMRGRKYREPKSLLLVLGEDRGARKAFRNFPGVDVALARTLSIKHLAPGGVPGRLTLYTETALAKLISEREFE
ncbi:MAG: 50S ribosomal protein L4 [Thermoprotei archaeon]|nr:MAG: 50S ribosomal protein L4 [Thermoprotei archaeon]